MAGRRSSRTLAGLAESTPSEAGLEANILRYLAACIERQRCLPERWVTITLPTQPEEHKLGFDAAARLSPGRYAVLQFKRPHKPKGRAASFCIETGQFCTLLRYPPGSAFYVLPAVETNRDMWDVRAGLLDRTCLVDAWDLVVPLLAAGRQWPQRGNPFGECTRTIHVDGCCPCTASVPVKSDSAGSAAARRWRVYAQPARALCAHPPRAGFVVVGGRSGTGAAGAGRGGTAAGGSDGGSAGTGAAGAGRGGTAAGGSDGGSAERIMTAGGVRWSRDEALRLLRRALKDLPPSYRERSMRGAPDDDNVLGKWAASILDHVKRGRGGRGRGSRHVLGFGNMP